MLTSVSYSPMARLRTAILIFDAAGLALFAVAGAEKALARGLNPLMAALLGMLTGIGGGIVRDLLVARTPAVLQSDVYALAALAGACFGLRLMAIHYGWNLSDARPAEGGEDGDKRWG